MSGLPTFSSLELAEHCQWWLSDDAQAQLEKLTPMGGGGVGFGLAWHELADRHVKHGGTSVADVVAIVAEQQLNATDADRLAAMRETHREELDRIVALGASSELAVALDIENGGARVLTPKHHRDYSDVKPGEIPGTLDLAWREVVDGVQIAVVRDWKTGHPMYTTPAAYNLQLFAQALAIFNMWAVARVRIELAFVDDDAIHIDSHTLDAVDLEAIEAQFCDLMTADQAEPRPGTWCHAKHCKARTICPATVELAEQVGTELDVREPDAIVDPVPGPFQVEILNGGHAEWLRERCKLVLALVDHVKESLKSYADEHGGVGAGDGKHWIRSTITKDVITLDVDAVLKFGVTADELDTLAPRSTSKARIVKAIGKERGAELVEFLRDNGHIKPVTHDRYDVRKKKEKETK
jgi:hypothetical protein